jgi:hypothetical protein
VAGICRDLGLKPDWLALAEDCYPAEAALSGKAGQPPAEPEDLSGPIEVRWLDSEEPASRRDSS